MGRDSHLLIHLRKIYTQNLVLVKYGKITDTDTTDFERSILLIVPKKKKYTKPGRTTGEAAGLVRRQKE